MSRFSRVALLKRLCVQTHGHSFCKVFPSSSWNYGYAYNWTMVAPRFFWG